MGWISDNAHGPAQQSFFASFCSQKEVFPSPAPLFSKSSYLLY
jgi:hypothetical protein